MDFKTLLVRTMNDWVFNHFFYYYLHLKTKQTPKILNINNPKTFNEKTIWLKMNYSVPNSKMLADKLLVKNFVADLIGKEYIIPTIAIFDGVDAIDYNNLPNSFVIKANHGSGWNVICRDKSKLNIPEVETQLGNWLKTNYYDISREPQYKEIDPKIFCETYLNNTPENPLIDYKIFCFDGIPKIIQVDLDRFTNHSRNFYDLDWNMLPFTTLYKIGKNKLPRPDCLDKMVSIAAILSRGLVFSRIDLYVLNRQIFFGEITLHHGGGFEPFIPQEYDSIIGRYFVLPK